MTREESKAWARIIEHMWGEYWWQYRFIDFSNWLRWAGWWAIKDQITRNSTVSRQHQNKLIKTHLRVLKDKEAKPIKFVKE